MRFPRLVFLIAGLYGLAVLVPQFFMEAKTGRDYPPPVTHPEFYYGFLGVCVAWQIAFLILSRNPVRYRAMMIPATIEKLGFSLAVFVLYAQRRVALPMLLAGIIDAVFAALFALAYAKTEKQ